jgi:hypothetical protein
MLRATRALPPSGSLPSTLQTLACRRWPHRYLRHCHAHIGDRFTIYPFDLPPLVFVTSPSDIRAVLTGDPSHLHPGEGATMIAPLTGERSFMLLEEDEHLSGRRTVTPAFHRKAVADHSEMLLSAVEREVASWPLDTALSLDPRIRSLTLRVILEMVFGERDRALRRLHALLLDMLAITTTLTLQEPKTRRIPGWRRAWRAFLNQRAEIDALIYCLMRRRRSEERTDIRDLLDMTLAGEGPGGSPMPDRDIRDNLMSMLIAGHETTTGELAWAFQLLAHNPDVQSRLIEEIDGGVDDEYLTATVHETLRHKPVFLFTIPRKVARTVEIGGWTYPPEVHLAGCTYLMHHDRDLYPEPDRFRPERFLGTAPNPYTWLPWGGGRKHCVGRHFALAEMRAIVRAVLATKRVLPAGPCIEQPRWRSAIVVPRSGCQVILRRRRR